MAPGACASLNSASGRTSRIKKLFSVWSRKASFTSTLLTLFCSKTSRLTFQSSSAGDLGGFVAVHLTPNRPTGDCEKQLLLARGSGKELTTNEDGHHKDLEAVLSSQGFVKELAASMFSSVRRRRLSRLIKRVRMRSAAVEVYFDFMRSFRVEFDEFFVSGIFSEIEVGLGPCGELRFPSYPEKHGWRYPGIGEFQCYDQYLLKSLRKAAEARGHTSWARGPDNAGSYNSRPHDTGFFRDGGDYDSYYGRFFLKWYSQVLVEHGDHVLSLAKLAFEGTCIAAKVSGIHWWYKTASHAAELTAGFYNPCNRDGYAPIAAMLKKHDAALNFTCVELRTLDQNEEFPEALADPEGLVWQVLNAAWDACIPVASENALPCYDRDGFNKILENAKPLNDPDRRHLSTFTYLRLSLDLMERQNLLEFAHFVKRMHGEAISELPIEAEEKI